MAAGICISCSEKKSKKINNNNLKELRSEAQENKETWTNDDLKQYLLSAQKWEIDKSGCKDEYRADGKFVSGFDEKGEATTGTWKVISANTIELSYYGTIEKVVISSIAADSFKWGDHVSIAENQHLNTEIKSKIKLFAELDHDELTEKDSDTEEYYIYNPEIVKIVKTDDGSDLNIREKPVNGKIIGQFSDGEIISVSKRTKEKYTVDNINDYWYYGFCYADIVPWGGWVFGGYLADKKD